MAGAKANGRNDLSAGMETLTMERPKDSARPPPPLPMGGEPGPVTYKVAFAVPMPGPLQVLTARHEDLVVDAYPVPPYLLLQCTGQDEDFDGVLCGVACAIHGDRRQRVHAGDAVEVVGVRDPGSFHRRTVTHPSPAAAQATPTTHGATALPRPWNGASIPADCPSARTSV